MTEQVIQNPTAVWEVFMVTVAVCCGFGLSAGVFVLLGPAVFRLGEALEEFVRNRF